jgi:hypothetical protein
MLDPILQILVQNGYLDEATANDLTGIAKTEFKSVRQLVIDQGILSEDDLLGAMAAYRAAEVVSQRYNVASGTEDLTPGAAYAILRLIVTPENYRY